MNPLTEAPQFAFRNLTHQGLRSYLTLLGVVIGIAAIVTLFSLGSGLNNAAVEQFEKLGSNTLFLAPSQQYQSGGSPLTNFKALNDSVKSRIESIPEVDVVLAPISASTSLEYGRESIRATIIATSFEENQAFSETGFLELEEGRFLENRDVFAAIIGNSVANDAFEKEIRLGDKVEIEGHSFKVVGISKASAQSFGGGPNTNNTIFTTKKAFVQLFADTDPVFMLIKTTSKDDVSEVQRKVERILEQEFGRDQQIYAVSTSEQLLDQIGQFLGIIQLVLVGIASISLLVGGIGIMNTMIMSVLERTSEIGTMKAVGATNTLVLSIFLLEAGFIGLVGGVFGILIGYGLAFLVGIISVSAGLALKVEIDIGLILGSMLFAMLVGMLSGLIPARRAARMDPVVALRGVD